ncbi:GNAT family N-acetyltransferase [uncultured Tyzzerella sp.]|uniref:GNAT family N-acetyltransferase n=1 Tax=uncultured Tyzzerella sp. TaxID=2321398 RepID=UPI0029438AED|nr:GNAT family N-acetyltransferase [uncultured Tyzzerella sp.]
MSDITYRRINKKDYGYIKHMMNKNFCLYEYIEDERILQDFLNSYLYSCLAEKTFSMIAEKDGKVVGVILGNSKKHYKVYKALLNNIKSFYYTSLTAIKSKIFKTNIKQYRGIIQIYNELMKKANRDFDGVLTLFVVSEEYQGCGIGKKLLSYFFEYGKQNKIKKLYVYTDSKCNYKFYDSQGFIKLNEDTFKVKTLTNQFDLNIFLYEYNFI